MIEKEKALGDQVMRFDNVYFINGTAYAGKSTMVHLLAEKYGGIECGENYHDQLLSGLDDVDYVLLGISALGADHLAEYDAAEAAVLNLVVSLVADGRARMLTPRLVEIRHE